MVFCYSSLTKILGLSALYFFVLALFTLPGNVFSGPHSSHHSSDGHCCHVWEPLGTIISVILQVLTKNDKAIYMLGLLCQKNCWTNPIFLSFHKIRVAKSDILMIFFAKVLERWYSASLKFVLMNLDIGFLRKKLFATSSV